MNTQATAVVLFAHGSRDPLWRVPIDAVALEIGRQAPDTVVHCAFLELTEPDLPTLVERLLEQGHRTIRIVPMFLGVGRHAREDLPNLVEGLRARHPEVQLDLQPALGEQAEMTRCMARLALAGLTPDKT